MFTIFTLIANVSARIKLYAIRRVKYFNRNNNRNVINKRITNKRSPLFYVAVLLVLSPPNHAYYTRRTPITSRLLSPLVNCAIFQFPKNYVVSLLNWNNPSSFTPAQKTQTKKPV